MTPFTFEFKQDSKGTNDLLDVALKEASYLNEKLKAEEKVLSTSL
jgi:hypothetical protein